MSNLSKTFASLMLRRRSDLFHNLYKGIAVQPAPRTNHVRKLGLAYVPSRLMNTPAASMAEPPTSLVVAVTHEQEMVYLETEEGRKLKYPSVWLRDNCQCHKCFESSSLMRKILISTLNPDVLVKDVKLSCDKSKIEITFDDGHTTEHGVEWLLKREFKNALPAYRKILAKGPTKVLWDSSTDLSYHQFPMILRDDKALYAWLHDLLTYGLTIVRDMPEVQGSLKCLYDRIGSVRGSHYGNSFSVKSKANPSNIAYAPVSIGLHCDQPYNKDFDVVQFLHCMQQAGEGGENEFADSFKAEDIMRKNHPKEWKILNETTIDFFDYGVDTFGGFYRFNHKTTFDRDEDGELKGIYFNQASRDSRHTLIDAENVKEYYKAMKLFNSILYNQGLIKEYKLLTGECAVFVNRRVLHGRKEYKLRKGETREYHGCYVDVDEIKSKVNYLRENLNL